MSSRPKLPDAPTRAVTVCDAATTPPFLPVESGDVTGWVGNMSVLPAFDLHVWANGTVSLTGIELYGLVTVDAVAKWMLIGFLGVANDGAINLTVNKGYATRIEHDPRIEAYAIAGVHPGIVEVTCTLHGVQEI